MQRFITAAAIATALMGITAPSMAAPADPPSAAELREPEWLAEPSAADRAEAYPNEAAKKGVSGHSEISCVVEGDGRLTHCTLVKETPEGMGFGDASLKLADRFRIKPGVAKPDTTGVARITIPIHWATVQHPDWVSRPSSSDFGAHWPSAARDRGIDGHVVMRCAVTVLGTLDHCVVTGETPLGMGYGAATLRLASTFRMRPTTVDGRPVGGAVVEIPVSWSMSGAPAAAVGGVSGVIITVFDPTKRTPAGVKITDCPTAADKARKCVLHLTQWDSTADGPTLAAILAQYKLHDGHSRLFCKVGDKGLEGCTVGAGVTADQEAAMRALAVKFAPMYTTADGEPTRGQQIIVLFDWAELAREANRAAMH